MRPSRFRAREESPRASMTPMIDVVFQLLVFFLLTLKVFSPEGDFEIKMPAAAAGESDAVALPVTVHLAASPDGRLAGVCWSGQEVKDFGALRRRARDLLALQPGPGSPPPEVVLDCDSQLHYEHVIDAITALSGHRADDGRTVVCLFESIRLVVR